MRKFGFIVCAMKNKQNEINTYWQLQNAKRHLESAYRYSGSRTVDFWKESVEFWQSRLVPSGEIGPFAIREI